MEWRNLRFAIARGPKSAQDRRSFPAGGDGDPWDAGSGVGSNGAATATPTATATAPPAARSVSATIAAYETESDAELLRRIQNQDPQAAGVLYWRYAGRLRALAHAKTPLELKPIVESVDIVQSAMGSFFRRASQGDYDLPDGLELWSLLLVITIHKIRDAGAHHRCKKRDARRTTRIDGTGWDQLGLCDPRTNETQLRLMIDELLDTMDDDRKLMVELRIAGFTVDEIAAKTKRAKRTVERLLQDVRIQFHKALVAE